MTNRWIFGTSARRRLRLTRKIAITPPEGQAQLSSQVRGIRQTNNQTSEKTTAELARAEAVRCIRDAYEHYNGLCNAKIHKKLSDCELGLSRAAERIGALVRERAELDDAERTHKMMLNNYDAEYSQCDARLEELWDMRDSYAKEASLLSRVLLDIGVLEAEREQKGDLMGKAAKRLANVEHSVRLFEDEQNAIYERILRSIAQMSDLAQIADIPAHNKFTEHCLAAQGAFDFSPMLEKVKSHIIALQTGLITLQSAERLLPRRDEVKAELAGVDKLAYESGQDLINMEAAVVTQRNTLADELDNWGERNKRLFVHPEIINIIKNFIDNYDASSSDGYFYPVEQVLQAMDGAVQQKIGAAKERVNRLVEQKALTQSKMRKLRESNDSYFTQLTDEALENRRQLHEAGIPFAPFYRYLSFKENVDSSVASRIEEALTRAGVLGALVIPDKYREAVLSSKTAYADKYIFIFDKLPKQDKDYDLTRVLECDGNMRDLLENTLKAVYYGVEHHTSIDPSGVFRMGAITGTIKGDSNVQYIGAAQREQSKAAAIFELQEDIKRFIKEQADVEAQIAAYLLEARELRDEYARMPKLDKLTKAINASGLLRNRIFIMNEKREALRPELSELNAKIDAPELKNINRDNISDAIVKESDALTSAQEYLWLLLGVINEHNVLVYRNEKRDMYASHLEDCQDILLRHKNDYDAINNRINNLMTETDAIKQTLRENGYDDLVEEIGAKALRMKEIIASRDVLVHSIGKYEQQRIFIERDAQKTRARKLATERDMIMLTQASQEDDFYETAMRSHMPQSIAEAERFVRALLFERAIELFPYNITVDERDIRLCETDKMKKLRLICHYDGMELTPGTLYDFLKS
ncbi:MAG: hypothetical protein LBL96_00970 [Clostridiales bacterium]|nr:hypothetical protein [Clostridiales bacterium]